MLVSPCDAIIGASGSIEDGQVLQIKGFPYRLLDLLGNEAHATVYRNGCYVTLRLTSAMYHRFHAPHDCNVGSVTYISGDTWNVNPIALKRVERLFCKNERAAIRVTLSRTGHHLTMVPVAAILVASIRLNFLDTCADVRCGGPRTVPLDVELAKGEEMGWFQHGSTIIVLAPEGFTLTQNVRYGSKSGWVNRSCGFRAPVAEEGTLAHCAGVFTLSHFNLAPPSASAPTIIARKARQHDICRRQWQGGRV